MQRHLVAAADVVGGGGVAAAEAGAPPDVDDEKWARLRSTEDEPWHASWASSFVPLARWALMWS